MYMCIGLFRLYTYKVETCVDVDMESRIIGGERMKDKQVFQFDSSDVMLRIIAGCK